MDRMLSAISKQLSPSTDHTATLTLLGETKRRTDGYGGELGAGSAVDVGVLSEPVDDLGVGCVEMMEIVTRSRCIALSSDQDKRMLDVWIDFGEETFTAVYFDENDAAVWKIRHDETMAIRRIFQSFLEVLVGPAIDPVGQIAKVPRTDELGIVVDRVGRSIEVNGEVVDGGCVTAVWQVRRSEFKGEYMLVEVLNNENAYSEQTSCDQELLFRSRPTLSA